MDYLAVRAEFDLIAPPDVKQKECDQSHVDQGLPKLKTTFKVIFASYTLKVWAEPLPPLHY